MFNDYQILTFNLPINQRYLVEKKDIDSSDNRWYNLYSDGWCIQGGVYSSSVGNNVKVEIVLLKEYTDNKYNITVTLNRGRDSDSGIPSIYGTPTTTSFKYMNDGDYDENGFRWSTCGYTSAVKSQSIIKY